MRNSPKNIDDKWKHGLALECHSLKAESLPVQLFDNEANQVACVCPGEFFLQGDTLKKDIVVTNLKGFCKQLMSQYINITKEYDTWGMKHTNSLITITIINIGVYSNEMPGA